MYVPAAFRMDEIPAIHAAMRSVRLANLITVNPLLATPLPMLLNPDEGEFGTLYAHLSKGNPQWRSGDGQEALVTFMGPDAYVSPSWYATKHIDGKVVPTWNYVTVHAYGPVEFFHEPERLRDVVTRLTTRHEAERADPWAVSDAPSDYITAHMRGIVGIRLPITRLEGKHKLSQNRSAADRTAVEAGLTASLDPADQQTAAAMRDAAAD